MNKHVNQYDCVWLDKAHTNDRSDGKQVYCGKHAEPVAVTRNDGAHRPASLTSIWKRKFRQMNSRAEATWKIKGVPKGVIEMYHIKTKHDDMTNSSCHTH